MPLSISPNQISSPLESSALDHPQSPRSKHENEVEHGATQSGPEHFSPDETSSFLTSYSSDHAAPTEGENQLGNTQPDLRQNEIEMRKAADASDGRQPDALQ